MPIVRLTDKEELRKQILAGRDAGDKRWQQKWDDLDAFPYDATDQHQMEYLQGRPVLVQLLEEAGRMRAERVAPQQATPNRQPPKQAQGPRPPEAGGYLPPGFFDKWGKPGAPQQAQAPRPKYVPPVQRPPLPAPRPQPQPLPDGLDRWLPPGFMQGWKPPRRG